MSNNIMSVMEENKDQMKSNNNDPNNNDPNKNPLTSNYVESIITSFF